MLADLYTKSLEQLITEGKISLYYRSWTGKDLSKGHWLAKVWIPKEYEAIGETPREAIIKLFKLIQ